MTWLAFDVEALRPLYEHAAAAPHREPTYGQRIEAAGGDWDRADALTQEEKDAACKPGLTLVKDDGIYLMSNGSPALMDPINRRSPNGKHLMEVRQVVYAKGYDPRVDPGVWELSRRAVGGDDFADAMDPGWLKQVFDCPPGSIKTLRIKVTADQIECEAR